MSKYATASVSLLAVLTVLVVFVDIHADVQDLPILCHYMKRPPNPAPFINEKQYSVLFLNLLEAAERNMSSRCFPTQPTHPSHPNPPNQRASPSNSNHRRQNRGNHGNVVPKPPQSQQPLAPL